MRRVSCGWAEVGLRVRFENCIELPCWRVLLLVLRVYDMCIDSTSCSTSNAAIGVRFCTNDRIMQSVPDRFWNGCKVAMSTKSVRMRWQIRRVMSKTAGTEHGFGLPTQRGDEQPENSSDSTPLCIERLQHSIHEDRAGEGDSGDPRTTM